MRRIISKHIKKIAADNPLYDYRKLKKLWNSFPKIFRNKEAFKTNLEKFHEQLKRKRTSRY